MMLHVPSCWPTQFTIFFTWSVRDFIKRRQRFFPSLITYLDELHDVRCWLELGPDPQQVFLGRIICIILRWFYAAPRGHPLLKYQLVSCRRQSHQHLLVVHPRTRLVNAIPILEQLLLAQVLVAVLISGSSCLESLYIAGKLLVVLVLNQLLLFSFSIGIVISCYASNGIWILRIHPSWCLRDHLGLLVAEQDINVGQLGV